jgi:hypothetical protein
MQLKTSFLFVGVAAMCAAAIAQSPSPAEARCAKEVRDYFETMKFIRQNAGDGIGDRVAAGYLSEREVQRIQGSEGACAAAQRVRERARAAG